MTTAKDFLLLQIENTIEWRTRKAIENPGDRRNLTCAIALEEAANLIELIPENHCLFTVLSDVDSETLSNFLGRWGFFNKVTPVDGAFGFFEALSALATGGANHE